MIRTRLSVSGSIAGLAALALTAACQNAAERAAAPPTPEVRLRPTEPVDHPTFLALASRARLVVPDSGGVQEEVIVLRSR